MYHLYKTAATHTYLDGTLRVDNSDGKNDSSSTTKDDNCNDKPSPSSQQQQQRQEEPPSSTSTTSPSDLKLQKSKTSNNNDDDDDNSKTTSTATSSLSAIPKPPTKKILKSATKKSTSKSALALRSILEAYKACDVVTFIETKLAPLEPPHTSMFEPRREGAKIIELDSSMTPLEASTVLWEGNVLGAPVWDEREKRYVGFFDMRNMLQVLIESANIVQHSKDAAAAAAAIKNKKEKDEEERQRHLLHVPDHKWGLKTHHHHQPSSLLPSSSPTSSATATSAGAAAGGKSSGFHSVFANELNRRESNAPSTSSSKTTTKLSPSSKSTNNVLHTASSPPSAQTFYPSPSTSPSSNVNSSLRTYRRNTSFNTTYIHQRHAAISLDPFPSAFTTDTAKETSHHHHHHQYHPINNTINAIASKQRFYSCNRQTKLDDLCRVLSMLGCHRMPIVDDRRVVSIVSQSALIAFLDEKLHPYIQQPQQPQQHNDGEQTTKETEVNLSKPLPLRRCSSKEHPTTTPPSPHKRQPNPSLNETLESAGLLYHKNVISVAHTTTAYQTFQILFSAKLSGVAIINASTQKLVDCTSARDIKRAALDEGKTSMDLPILEYLKSVRENELVMQQRRIKKMELYEKKMLKRRQLSDASLDVSFDSEDEDEDDEDDMEEDEVSEEMEDKMEVEEKNKKETTNNKNMLIQPTTSYKDNDHSTTNTKENECTACHISENATVGQILSLLARTKSHRVFIVDHERKPVGVVSVTNIINFALGRPQSVEDHPHD